MIRRLALLLLLLPGLRAHAQGTNAVPASYQFDLGRNFFADTAVATRARTALTQRFRELGTMVPAAKTPPTLLRALATSDTLMRELGKQYAYLSLRSSVDTRDMRAATEMNALGGVAEPVLAELRRALGNLQPAEFASYARSEPRLARYTWAHALARRENEHRLDAASEGVLNNVAFEATTWGPSLFQTLIATTPWGKVKTPEGELDFQRQGNQIRNHADRAVREKGYRLGQAGVETHRDTYAFILSRSAQSRNTLAQQRRWRDYPAQTYAALELTTPQVRALLTTLEGHADVNKRYERARIAEVKRDLGVDSVHTWDLGVPVAGRVAPRFSIDSASRVVLAAANPLGAGYQRELAALLDPANGRLDLVPRPNRVDRPGFSTGSVGYPSTFFQGRFEGYVEDLVILSHEAGHAAQNMLMDSAGVLPRYAGGPNYFTESFANLSQLLLLEHLVATSTTDADREYYRRRLLDDAMDLFRNAHESLVELQLYDSVAAGRQLGADGMERLMQDVGSRFSVWYGPGSERVNMWVQPIQFFTRPLYRVNYVIAKLLALQYLDQLHRDPATFARQYGALLRNGYDAAPDELLRRHMNVSLSDADALVNGGMRVVEQWMKEMETSETQKQILPRSLP